MAETINNASDHYLSTDSSNFYLGLYFANERVIVCDYSKTAFIDTVVILQPDDAIPDLRLFVTKIKDKEIVQ